MRTVVVLALALGACSRGASTPSAREAQPTASGPSAAASTDAAPSSDAPPDADDASSAATASAALQCALDAPGLAQYLHPEVPGRVPVRVRLPAELTLTAMPQASGASIEIVASDALLEVVSLRIDGATATMQLEIPAEGVVGEVACTRASDAWRPTTVALRER